MKRLLSLVLCVCLFGLSVGAAATDLEVVANCTVTLDFSFGERTGQYTGEMKNGVPHGYGVFESVNLSGEYWVHVGSFSDGHFEGKGRSLWELGHTQNGMYTLDVLTSGTNVSPSTYDVSEGTFSESGFTGISKVFDDERTLLSEARYADGEEVLATTTPAPTSVPSGATSPAIPVIDIDYLDIVKTISSDGREISTEKTGTSNQYEFAYYFKGISYEDAKTKVFFYFSDNALVAIFIYCTDFSNGEIESIYAKTVDQVFGALGIQNVHANIGKLQSDGRYQWHTFPIKGKLYSGNMTAIAPIGSTFDMYAPPGISFARIESVEGFPSMNQAGNTELVAAKETDAPKQSVPQESEEYYSEGQYKVGDDLPAGEYVLLNNSSRSGYFCVSSDANGDDILFNDNFDYNSIITVKKGEYVELNRCEAVPSAVFYTSEKIPADEPGSMLKVGVDIAPGEYKLIAESDSSGYYCVYPDSRHQKIITNDNFKNSARVKVKKGQYLVLNRCTISQ